MRSCIVFILYFVQTIFSMPSGASSQLNKIKVYKRDLLVILIPNGSLLKPGFASGVQAEAFDEPVPCFVTKLETFSLLSFLWQKVYLFLPSINCLNSKGCLVLFQCCLTAQGKLSAKTRSQHPIRGGRVWEDVHPLGRKRIQECPSFSFRDRLTHQLIKAAKK